MTKKDYITIANALRPIYLELENYQAMTGFTDDDDVVTLIINAITKQIKKDNPTFDPVKFLDYLRGYKR